MSQTPSTDVVQSLEACSPGGNAIDVLIDVIDDNHLRTEESVQRLAAIVDSAEDAIISKDLNGIIKTWNKAAERIFGYAPHEIVGKSVLTLIPEDRLHEEDTILGKIRSGERVEHFETVRRRKDGTLIDISLTISPILDANGTIVGASKIARDITDKKRWERLQQKHSQRLSMLNRVARELQKDLDLERIVKTVVDLATDLADAKWGAFFYTVNGEKGAPHLHSAFSGESGEKFARLAGPYKGEVFAETFRAFRSADIRNDTRYRKKAAFRAVPGNDPNIVSYLAVPVFSGSGKLLGGLLFAHDAPGIFSGDGELLVSAIAAQAGLALENAKLHRAAEIEIAERKKAEAAKQLLVNEIRHRIKNTLGMVQAMARQTLHAAPAQERDAFVSRLHAMNDAHEVLTGHDWQSADIQETVERAMRPFGVGDGLRVSLAGPSFALNPNKALFLAMLLHELGTNAVKYGALSNLAGRIDVGWDSAEEKGRKALVLHWRESGGPEISQPTRKGFGSRLVESVVKAEQGSSELIYAPEGFRCTIRMAL